MDVLVYRRMQNMAQIVPVQRKLQTGITSAFNLFILCSCGDAFPYFTSRGFWQFGKYCFSCLLI